MLNNDIYKKNVLNILSYISKHTTKSRETTASVISKRLNLSIGSVYETLKVLQVYGLIDSIVVGRATLYEPVRNNYLLKHFKIFDNLVKLQELAESLKGLSKKVILFGSCARGEDTLNSDIDLFVLTEDEYIEEVRKIIYNYEIDREIKPIIVDTFQLISIQTDDKVFWDEVNKGIILWEGKDESRKVFFGKDDICRRKA